MLPTPSYRVVPLETVLLWIQGYEEVHKALRSLRYKKQAEREFARITAKSEETRACLRMVNKMEEQAARSIRSWMKSGCTEIEREHVMLSDPGIVPIFVVKVWSCFREVERTAPDMKSRWLECLPIEISSFIKDINSHIP